MTNYEGLGFDPTPGEPGAVKASLEALATTGQQLGLMMGNLQDALDVSGGWSGDAADDFHDNGDDLPSALANGAESMGTAADALGAWGGQLVGNKQQAEVLDKLARELKRQLATAEATVASAATGVRTAGRPQQAAADRAYGDAVGELTSLRDQLAAVIDEAHQLAARHLAQANAAAAKIRGANDDAFEPVGGFVQAVGVVSTVMSEVSAWSGRAAFVAALIPGGQVAAGALAITAAATGVAGAGGGSYARTQNAPDFANRSTIGLAADGVLSIGGPAGKGTTGLLKVLRAGGTRGAVKELRKATATQAAAAAIGKGRYAGDLARKIVDDAPLGKAIKAYQDGHGANSVTDAMRRIGEVRARDLAERGAVDKALEGTAQAGSGVVGAADRLDRSRGGDGVPDWMKPVAKAPHLPSAMGEAATQAQKKAID